jgi:hypothetical protein
MLMNIIIEILPENPGSSLKEDVKTNWSVEREKFCESVRRGESCYCGPLPGEGE